MEKILKILNLQKKSIVQYCNQKVRQGIEIGNNIRRNPVSEKKTMEDTIISH